MGFNSGFKGLSIIKCNLHRICH